MKRFILFILPCVLIGVRGFCDEPDVPAHSFIFMTSPDLNGSNYDEGTQIRYRCNEHYHLWGDPVRTCEQNGRWTSINFECKEITCGYIAPPENGRVKNAPTYKTGTFMEFECYEGFRMTGSQRYLCGVDGEWRYGIPAKCEHVYCPELRPVNNGEIFQDTYDGIRNNFGSAAEYTCRRGYRVFGTMDEYTRICGADGKWSGTVPYCEAPQCDEILTYNGGTVKYYGNRRQNTKVVLRCDPGYTMYPERRMILTCKRITDTIYIWEPEPSFCYKKQVIDIPDNCETSRTNKELLHMESYHLSAKPGYEFKQNSQYLDINSNRILITNNNGTLEPTRPQCKPARCSTTNRNNMHVYFLDETRADGKVESGSNYKFMCPMNFEFQDDKYLKTSFIIVRCDLGHFVNIPTTCVERRCRLNNDDIALRRGTTKLSVINHNQQVHVQCKSTRHELYNPNTGEYPKPFYVWCIYGKFQNFVNELKCLPRRCDTSQLKNTQVSDLNSVATDKFVESNDEYLLRCNFNYEFMEYPETEYIKKRCDFGNFESVSHCVPKKCRLRNDDIILDHGRRNRQVIDHNNEVHVKCKSDHHELYNPETGEYQEPFSVRCNYGKFFKFVNELKCLPRRCDISQLKNIQVSDLNNLATDKLVESNNEYMLRCNVNYEFMEYPEKEYIKTRCDYGNFERVLSCEPKKCRLSNTDIELHFGNMKSQDITHNSQGRVQCELLTYELYNPSTGEYKKPFDVRCNYGKFSEVVNELTCRLKRCDTSQLQHMQVLYLNYSSTDKFVESSARYRLRCESKYEFAENNIDSIISVCEGGKFKDHGSSCLPKNCTVVFQDSNTHYNDGNAAFSNGTVVSHDTEVNASCLPQYELYMDDKFLSSKTFHSARCEYGVLKLPQCVEKRCRISPLEGYCYRRKNGMSRCINRAFHFRHQKSITLTCEANYSLFWINSSGEIMSEEPAVLVCDKGTVHERYRCSPDPCPIPSLFNASTNYTHEEVKSGDQVTFLCNEGHHLENTVNDTIWTGECKAALFKDLPNGCVPDNCALTDVRNGHYIRVDSGETVTRMVIRDGESVQLKCFDGFYIVNSRNEIISAKVSSIYCDKGSLTNTRHQCKKCKSGNETRQSISNTDRSLTTSGVRDNIMHCEEYDNNGNDDHATIPTTDVIGTATDCVIKESSVYKYTDKNGKELQPLEDTIQNGDMINVECLFSDDYEYYYGYDYTEDNSEEELYTVTCINGTLTSVNLVCKEDPIGHNENCDDVIVLSGIVTRSGTSLDKYTVKCDSGFHLNVRTEVPCSCDSGQIKCAGGEIPRCLEANCTLPPNFDRRLTLSQHKNGKERYLGGVSVVKPREQVVFSCSKVIDQIYEPFNRIFECRYGKWIAADEKDWSFEYNDTFPKCRKAECNPPCENNGICYRDDTCRCGKWYNGNRCEIVLCPEDCTRNNGTCDKSGSCVCPSDRHGKNCENRGCKLPEGAAEHKQKRIIFAGHETISDNSMICPENHRTSASYMTCLNNGSWTNVISCLRTNFKYVVSMRIANGRHASTRDNVNVKIIGKDRTTKEFEMPVGSSGKLEEINFWDIDVTPIEKVVISKDSTLTIDDNALISYVSIFVEESDEYYMFKDQHSENKWLKTNAPKTFTISAHPEPCRHTYGSALNRSPKQRSSHKTYTSVRGCKQYCVTNEHIKCVSVYFMPHNKSAMGYCYLYEVPAFSNTNFKDNIRSQTDAGYVSYNRICLMK